MDKKILDHFKKHDLILYAYAIKVGKLEVLKKEKSTKYFYRLCREIICQQLSDKAGAAIFTRFMKLFPASEVSVHLILKTPHEILRSTGMSNAKGKYLRNLADHIDKGLLDPSELDKMNDKDVIQTLIKVKGIGPWTAEMFLMFTLCRPDVFSFGDLGLKKAIIKLYGFKKEPKRSTIEKIVNKWSPYKTFAARILWTSLDNP